MKKILASIAVGLLAVSSASALSFDWDITKVSFNDALLKSDTTVIGYCVYLASGSYSTSYDLTDPFSVSSIGTIVGTKEGTSNKAKLGGTTTFDYGDYKNGDVFGFVLSYASGGKTYYNIASDTYTLSGIVDESSSLTTATGTFNYGTKGESKTISSGTGWTAVPEPSTAALALAGLALLIKRRRA